MDLVTGLIALGLASTTASVGMHFAEARRIHPDKPEYTYQPSAKGLYYSTVELCAGKPDRVHANYPAQTWEYKDCTVTFDANHVTALAGKCEVVRACR